MSFAQPAWLLLGLLGVVVVLLHVRRHEVVEVSTVELWRRLASAAQPRPSRRPPRPTLLLLLQLLALALLVLALAGPSWGPAPVRPDHLIVVLDASGSMTARDGALTRFERAVTRAERDLATRTGDETAYTLLSVGPGAHVEAARLDDPRELAAALARLEPTHGPAAWNEAAARLPGLTADGERVRLTVWTDGAGAGPAREALAAALPGAELELRAVGAGTPNVGFREARAVPVAPEEGRWRVEGAVFSAADEPEPLTLTAHFTPEGSERALAWAEEELEPEDGLARFALELELPGPGRLELRLPGDAVAHDDRVDFGLLAAERTARVLLVGPDDPPLQRALEAVGGVELFRADALPETSASFDLVIVDGVQVARHPGTHTVWLAGAGLESEPAPPTVDAEPTAWDAAHPLSASVDWSALPRGETFRTGPLPGARALVESAGEPLVQARATGAGREAVVALDPRASAWTERLGFPVFVANLVRWAVPDLGRAQGPRCVVGEACPLDPRLLYGGLELHPVGGGAPVVLPSPFVAGPDASPESAWAPAGFDELFEPTRAGAYRLGEDGPLLAVDAPAGGEGDVRADGDADGGAGPAASSGWRAPRWLLLLAVAVLLLEAWLAGRGADRFLRPHALRRDNPLAGRHRAVLGLRAGTLLFVALALLGASLPLPVRERRLAVLLDRPDLYAAGGDRGRLERLLADVPAEEIVLLEGTGRIAAAPSDAPSEGWDAARLGPAIDLASGLLGERGARRVLVAGGGEQLGDGVPELIPGLAARGVAVDVLPLGAVPPGEVLIERLELPPALRAGDRFTLRTVVYSQSGADATLRMWREGEPGTEQRVRLHSGRNLVATELLEEEAGRYLYEVEVTAEGDALPENNRDGAIVRVAPPARLALITPQLAWGEVLAGALEGQGVQVDVRGTEHAPWAADDLLRYDAVAIANVPAIELHSSQQEALATWVERHGGGLLLLGGENSFGPGGYYRTPLERISPLSSRIPREAPKVAMLFVLDRSGSMEQKVGNVTRMDIAKQAAADAIALLHPDSLTGVVVFDTEPTALVPLQRAGDLGPTAGGLRALRAGGGTSLAPALELAYEELEGAGELSRHVVVISDGLSEEGEFERILTRFAAEGISVSTVAVGRGADLTRLQGIARLGRGTFHATADVRALPSILSQEALLLAGTGVEEGAFDPRWGDRSTAFVAGLPDRLPPLGGFVRTSAKPDATVHLYAPEDMPLLASWRYGLGRVVAFASHGAGEWARPWLESPDYARLWAQAVRWSLPPVAAPGLHVGLERRGDRVEARVVAVGRRGDAFAGARLTGTSAAPSGEPVPLALRETEPGVHHGSFPVGEGGRYRVRVELAGETRPSPFGPGVEPTAEEEVFVGYPARYRVQERDAEGLRALAAATGGRVLLGDEPRTAGHAPLEWRWLPLTPLWLLLALAFLLTELVLRYAPGWLPRRRPAAPRGPRAGAA